MRAYPVDLSRVIFGQQKLGIFDTVSYCMAATSARCILVFGHGILSSLCASQMNSCGHPVIHILGDHQPRYLEFVECYLVLSKEQV